MWRHRQRCADCSSLVRASHRTSVGCWCSRGAYVVTGKLLSSARARNPCPNSLPLSFSLLPRRTWRAKHSCFRPAEEYWIISLFSLVRRAAFLFVAAFSTTYTYKRRTYSPERLPPFLLLSFSSPADPSSFPPDGRAKNSLCPNIPSRIGNTSRLAWGKESARSSFEWRRSPSVREYEWKKNASRRDALRYSPRWHCVTEPQEDFGKCAAIPGSIRHDYCRPLLDERAALEEDVDAGGGGGGEEEEEEEEEEDRFSCREDARLSCRCWWVSFCICRCRRRSESRGERAKVVQGPPDSTDRPSLERPRPECLDFRCSVRPVFAARLSKFRRPREFART